MGKMGERVDEPGSSMTGLATVVKPKVNARSMAEQLVAGSSYVSASGGYHISVDAVWEKDDEFVGYREKSTSTGEWVGGLAVACGLEISSTDIANIAFYVGRFAAEKEFESGR